MVGKARAKEEEEQSIKLLREILFELRKLNENLEKKRTIYRKSSETNNALDAEDEEEDDSEELEYFE
jgi:hypothetical protein